MRVFSGKYQQLCATERSTELGHSKRSGIGDRPSVCMWACWLVVCDLGVLGGVVLCRYSGDLVAACEVGLYLTLIEMESADKEYIDRVRLNHQT